MALHEAKSVEVAWHKAHQNKHRPLPIEQNNFQVSLQLVVNWSKTLKTWRLQDFRISTEHVETLWMTKAVSCIAWRSMTYDYHEMFHDEFLTISMVVDTGYLQTFGKKALRFKTLHPGWFNKQKRQCKRQVVCRSVYWTVDIAIANDYCGIFGVLVDISMYGICIETNNRFGMSHVDSRVCLFKILPERWLELIMTCTKIVRLHEERYRMNMNQNGRSRRGSSKWSEMHRSTGLEAFRNIGNTLKHGNMNN